MKVVVNIQQITHGTEYQGTFEGFPNTIDYKLCFGVPINKLSSQQPPEEKEKCLPWTKNLFQFTVTKSNTDLEISDELFGFMMQTAGELAVRFYDNPQTQDYASDGGIVSDAIRNKESSLLGRLGANVSIGMSTTYEVEEKDLPKELLN